MKTLTMQASLCALAVAMGAVLSPSVAEASTRSCHAAVMVTNQQRNMVTVFVNRFTASASGVGYNRNRRHASDRAASCLQAAWAHRYEAGFVPAECNASHGISGFNADRGLHHAIGYDACRAWHWSGSVRVHVRGYVWGDKGCSGRGTGRSRFIELASWYRISC